MSKTFKIFTSGAMGGLTYNEQMDWRLELEHLVFELTEKKVKFIHPPDFFDYDFHDQRVVKEWEINQLLDSDIVVINLSNIKNSIGTHIELGVVQAANRLPGHHITTIGIGEPNTDHPWIKSSIFYSVKDTVEAADFICKYLLI
ncbi:hypothetical protein [Ruminococcus sp. YE282]|uniref:hypothetical protein n=1 Tax=Ruminococcus sp. YE282 TaxID=3158780 RepID=UPI00087E8D0F|nr:hypothetical protein SAMN02910441_01221 [Ruminococcus bromii]